MVIFTLIEKPDIREIRTFDLTMTSISIVPEAKEIITEVSCTSSPNAVILAQTGELGVDTHTDTGADEQTQDKTISKGRNWPRLIISVDVT